MPLAVGTCVGRYEILDKLGVGGMSEVYRARDLELGREVAVKALPEAWGEDRETVERFEREAQLLAALRHPNIMVADVRLFPEFEAAKPRVLFETPFDSAGALHAGYDTGPDGTSFVMIRSEKESTASAIHVVPNWFEELKERAGSP